MASLQSPAHVHSANPSAIHSAIPTTIPSEIHKPSARPIALAYEALLSAHNGDRLSVNRSADDIYIVYTGGTTGLPKGVMWRHEDVFFAAMGGGSNGADPITTPEAIAERCVRGTTRLIVPCPFMHGTAHWMAFATLLTGGCVLPLQTMHFDPNEVLDVVEQHHANTVVIVGDAYAVPIIDAIAQRLTLVGSEPHRVDALSVVISGGAVLSPSIKRALLAALPHAVIVDGYGASETGGQGRAVCTAGQEVVATTFIVDADSEVLDDDGNPSAVGTVGRVARRGHVPLGYFNDPEKSAATFTTVRGMRWSIPGDHGIREPNGTITLLGRGSMCINTGGEKVYPDEVESVLKAHPAVFDVVVVGFADARFGQRVGAVVQLRVEGGNPREGAQHHGAQRAGHAHGRAH